MANLKPESNGVGLRAGVPDLAATVSCIRLCA